MQERLMDDAFVQADQDIVPLAYPTSEYMRDVNRMSVFIITIFIGCLAAVGLCVTLTIRRLSSPLNELSDRLTA